MLLDVAAEGDLPVHGHRHAHGQRLRGNREGVDPARLPGVAAVRLLAEHEELVGVGAVPVDRGDLVDLMPARARSRWFWAGVLGG